ncbi:hypothetical protein EIP86_000478 [Pleurotus ostreatoroseus]|nr:hypothetical protein EIP86_000478 [Pleurotus ostreatoroseus]
MLTATIRRQLLQPARCYSQAFAAAAPADAAAASRPAYFVPRNTLGSVPVYTDQVNTKYMTLIRNVEGDANALAADLKKSLFPPDSPEARRMKVETRRNRHVVLAGGKWKREVFDWLKSRGF